MSTQSLKIAVAQYYSGPEWSLSFEVGNSTGFNVKRHVDAVAFNLWPSRGLAVHGIEMKAGRADWQRELANPEKAEELHQYCDFWWLAATRGVVKDHNEVPPGWGFMEMTDGGTLRVKRDAAKLERNDALPRSFVAGLLKAVRRVDSEEFRHAVNAACEKERPRIKETCIAELRLRSSEATKRLEKLMVALGDDGLGFLDDEELCRAAAFVMKSGVASAYSGTLAHARQIESLARAMDRTAQQIRAAAEAIGLQAPEKAA